MKTLLSKLQARRQSWLVLDEARGLKVCVLRPPETEMVRLGSGIRVEHVAQYVNDWAGFTEATLLGDAIGSSDAVAFDADVWRELVADNVEWLQAVAAHIAEKSTEHLKSKADARKN